VCVCVCVGFYILLLCECESVLVAVGFAHNMNEMWIHNVRKTMVKSMLENININKSFNK
jgi:hypothetical protein